MRGRKHFARSERRIVRLNRTIEAQNEANLYKEVAQPLLCKNQKRDSKAVPLLKSLFVRYMPDRIRVLRDGAVGGEDAAAGDVDEGHAVPFLASCVGALLC